MPPAHTSKRSDPDTSTVFSAVECQQCGTITKIDFQNHLPTTRGYCGAGKEHLVER